MPSSSRRERRSEAGVRGECIFIVAPTGRDGRVAARVLKKAQLHSTCCTALTDLPGTFPGEAGALLLTEEALAEETPVEEAAEHLAGRLAGQPEWSRLPVVLLTGSARRSQTLRRVLNDACARHAHVTTLERPLRSSTLTAVVQTALQHRRRQYEVGGLLTRLEEKGEALEEKVTARTHALRERGAQVRALAEALTRAEQRERRRLSRVLHDHLQQLLYGMKVHAQMLRNDMSDEAGATGAAGGSPVTLLDELDAVADEAIELTRTLAIELNPPVLDEEGLPAALEWLAAQMQERHGLAVALERAHEEPALHEALPEELRALLFRLVRELLFNVVKHAHTDRATLTLRADAARDALTLTVADEGRGFDPDVVHEQQPTGPAPAQARVDGPHGAEVETGLGLFSVRERLALFDGEMTLDTAPGQGTRITLSVPV